ncbi:MAG TPA: hypothetical protein VFZ00_13505 [Solirubrobacter sp.]|nr:hypothetical protein [Solirubrobacter sp.]
MILPRIIIGAALALAVAAPAQAASDTVVATTARPTPLAAGGGHVLYSAWDGTSYRLTEVGSGPLPIEGSPHPFRVDIGRNADDHAVAVYPRCTDDDGCDLYMYDLETKRETRLSHASSPTDDEVAGAVWRDKLVFARLYDRANGPPRGVLYMRSLSHPRQRSVRLANQRAHSIDVRGTRVPFASVREWSREPWLAWTNDQGASRLTRVPGSGAAVDFLEGMNPTAYGSSIYWLYVRSGERHASEVHRYNRSLKRDERVPTAIPASASGFAYDAGAAYYAVPQNGPECREDTDCPTVIHRLDGLEFEKAPPIELH